MHLCSMRQELPSQAPISLNTWAATPREPQPHIRVPKMHASSGNFTNESVSTIESLIDMEIRSSQRLRQRMLRGFKSSAFQRELWATQDKR